MYLEILGDEMVRGGLSLIPYLFMGLALILLFTTFSIFYPAWRQRRLHPVLMFLVIGKNRNN